MTKEEALKLIDHHKNGLVNPVEMLAWTHLRVIIFSMTDEAWEAEQNKAAEILSR
jgi:hypothetical protein